MDLTSLVAANLSSRHRPSRTDARAEERYWRAPPALPRPGLRPLASIATAAGLILLLIGVAQA